MIRSPATFRGKLDWWFHLGAALMATASVVLVGTTIAEPAGHVIDLFLAAVIGAVLIAAVLPFYLRNHIDLEEETLHITAGAADRRVPYKGITSVRPLRSYTAHFLPSFDVVEVNYRFEGRERVEYVAPLDRERFLRELEERRK